MLASERLAVLSGYTRRLLSPPLPGDGLLIVGFAEGVIGWSLSWLLVSNPSLAPFGFLESVVLLWIALTAGIVVVGTVYTAPTVRRNRIWLVWAGLNASAVSINIAAILGLFPGPLQGEPFVADFLGSGYWRPWYLVLGLGYLSTAFYNWSNPQLRRSERAVYALGGVACLAVLSPWPSLPQPVGVELFLLGGLLHTIPMGFDVIADIVLIVRRTG
ncbi:hypothetical protein KM295_09675 [Natronomonas sp. F2-12]|jgi:hypothetical protein|uniref:Uncharacterized protein n=1 Tax=Natronomonas aquatica TaxID=2841590 RepID=A0A9R1CRB4_9EURY|nr:hypothetical protein [Natronomonas aquatica]MCQ4333743.1 hypothetical protein [Natronomonas aquatica]